MHGTYNIKNAEEMAKKKKNSWNYILRSYMTWYFIESLSSTLGFIGLHYIEYSTKNLVWFRCASGPVLSGTACIQFRGYNAPSHENACHLILMQLLAGFYRQVAGTRLQYAIPQFHTLTEAVAAVHTTCSYLTRKIIWQSETKMSTKRDFTHSCTPAQLNVSLPVWKRMWKKLNFF